MSMQNSNDSIAQKLLDEYNRHQEMNEDDSIDFGDGIAQDAVVSVQRERPSVPVPASEERTCTEIPLEKIEHKDGGTLMLNASEISAYNEQQQQFEVEQQMAPTVNSEGHSSIIMLLVALIAVAGILVLIIMINRAPEPSETADAPQTATETTKTRHYEQLVSTDTPIDISPRNSYVVINGAYFDILKSKTAAGNYPLLTDHDNVIAVYAEDRVPYISRIAQNHDYLENPLSIELMPDTFYQRSEVVIKAPSNVDVQNLQMFVNGQPLQPPMAEQRISCLSGFPYFVQVNAKDKGSHLHVFWPTRTSETIQLPDMELQSNADIVTILTLKLPQTYQQDSSLVVRVKAEGQVYNSPGTMRIGKGEFIDVSIQKNGRYPMDLAFDSTPFGSIYIDGYLQPSSKGIAQVHFSKQSDPNVKVCFRRASETICTVDAVTYVSSGKWELLAYRDNKDGTRDIFKEQPYETLKADHDYTMTISAGKTNFTYKITEKPIK